MRLRWTEIAFAISRLGKLVVPEPVIPFLDAVGLIPAVEVLRRAFTTDVKELQTQLFGWYRSELFAPYGVNEWTSRRDPGKLFRAEPHLPPAPAFNYRGLISLPAVVRDHLVLEPVRESTRTEDLAGNALLVGGTRVTPELRNFLKAQSEAPFGFVTEDRIPQEFRPPSPPPKIQRVFSHDGETFERTSVAGKYLVRLGERSLPPFGPFVDGAGRITGDVLVLTIARDTSGKRIVTANAGYGAADRLADILCNGASLESLRREVPTGGSTRLQAVYTLPVTHDDAGEQYGPPDLKAMVKY